MSSFHLRILATDKVIFDDEVDFTIVQGYEGQLTILPHHISFVTALKPGVISVKLSKDQILKAFPVQQGVLEMVDNQCTVLMQDQGMDFDFV